MFPILFALAAAALDTGALQQGIDQSAKTGKPFVIPAGTHLSGTLRVPSKARIELAVGAVLRMDPSDVLFDAPEKFARDPHADRETAVFAFALLRLDGVEDVVIEGAGLIDGNRDQRGGPKPISIKNSRNIRLANFTIQRAPNYAVSIIGSADIRIDGIRIENAWADGIDIDGTRDVVVRGVDVDSFDDAICLKTSAALGERLQTSGIRIEDSRLRSASALFKLGTESWGDFRDIAVRRVKMRGSGNRHANPGIALESVDGGDIEGVRIEDVEMEDVGTPIFLRAGERARAPGAPPPGMIRGVTLRRITARGTRHPSVFAGLREATIRGVSLDQVAVEPPREYLPLEASQSVPENRRAYPEPNQFGLLPATVFYARWAAITWKDVTLLAEPRQPVLVLDDAPGSFPGCSAGERNRWVCSNTRPSQRRDNVPRLPGRRLP
jgi:hypothetical protein